MGQQKRRTALKGFLLSMALLTSTTLAYAGPDSFNVQGRLVNTAGTPVSGSKSVVFKIQQVTAGGSIVEVWEDPQTVTFQNGIYSVTLGSASNPLTKSGASIFATDDPLQLLIVVDGTAFPAIPIRQTPLAIRAEMLGSKKAEDFILKPGTIASGDILYHNGADFKTLSLGSNGQVLTVNNGQPQWTSLSASILKTDFAGAGHLLVGDGAGACLSLAPGTADQVLTSNGTSIFWQTRQASIPSALLDTDGSMIVRAGGVPKELRVGNSGQYLTVQKGIPNWTNLPSFVTHSTFANDGSIAYGLGGNAKELPAGPANSVLCMDANGLYPEWKSGNFVTNTASVGAMFYGANGVRNELPPGPAYSVLTMDADGKYPKWASASYLPQSVFTGVKSLVCKTPSGPQDLALGAAGKYLASDGTNFIWADAPTSKVYAHFEAIDLAYGNIVWQQKLISGKDFTLEKYSSTANGTIRFNKTGVYLVTFQFIVNPNYNWNEMLLLPRDATTHSNNAVAGTMTSIASGNISISQSATTILSVTSLSNNTNVFRLATAGWGGPQIYGNKAFGKIVIIKID